MDKGILFTLKKRMQNSKQDDSSFYKYVACGYYDGLDINCVREWYEMRPKGLDSKNLIVSLEDPFVDQYTIKALFPENVGELEKKGFCYSLFQDLHAEKCQDYPFIAVSLVNVSERFCSVCSGLSELSQKVTGYVEESLKKNRIGEDKLECAVFPSLGYSDFIVAFLTNDLMSAAEVIDNLRKQSLPDGNFAFSSCYTVCGFGTSYECLKNIKENNKVKLSVRVNVKEGISSVAFVEGLKKAISTKYDGLKQLENQKKLLDICDKACYSTFGSSDSLILLEEEITLFIPLYLENNIFNPGGEFYQQYIANMETTVRIEGISLNPNSSCANEAGAGIIREKEKQKCENRIKNYEEIFKKFKNDYNQFIADNNIQVRMLKSFQQLMKNFLNISQLPHGFDVDSVLGAAFKSFINNMEYIFHEVKDKGIEGAGFSLEKIETASNQFRNVMGSYLADLTRSDKLFIEGQTLTHPSIGSATKLLFAYNWLINEVVQKLANEDNDNSKYTFLITSGGCDKTEALDIFDFLEDRDDGDNLIIVTIPEMSLYDVKGTLFRIIHECMHFCGVRKRKSRLDHLIKAISYTTANDLTKNIYSVDEFKSIMSDLKFMLEEATAEAVIRDIFEEQRKKQADEIADHIYRIPYFQKSANQEEKFYYLSYVQREYLADEAIADIFLDECETSVLNDICGVILRGKRELTEKVIGVAESYGIKYSQMNFILMRNKYLEKYQPYNKISIIVRKYFSYYMGELKLWEDFSPEHVQEFAIIRDNICTAMSECFSDCAAARILGIDFPDFVLAFIYEQWNIEEAFPGTVADYLRMGIDLKILFQIEERLTDEQKQQLEDRVEYWKERGFEYRNIPELIKKLDEILKNCSILNFFGANHQIEMYIKECLQALDNVCFSEMQKFSEKCSLETSKDFYEMMDFLWKKWEGLCNVS